MQIRSRSALSYVASLVPLSIVLLLCGVGWQEAFARPVTFTWDYSASGAAGFMLYCGPSSGNYTTRVDVLNTVTYTIATLPEGATSFCTVTAYDATKAESPHSNEVGILVQYSPPTVNFSPSPTSGAAPLSVVFSNTTAGSVTTWAWDFGDGTTSSVQSPTHVYSAAGNYTVVFTASGPGGSVSKTAATAISVGKPAAPVISFNPSPTVGSAPLNVAFTNSTTGQVTTWAWNFGDGTTSTLKSPTHTYNSPGSYSVILTATGPGGTVTKTASSAITVSSTPAVPVVNFSASVTSGTAPLTVAFSNTTTGSVTTWAWDFGDGTSSNAQSPTHIYTVAGIYRVTLTATGPGGSASKALVTAINVAAATTGSATSTVNFTASPSSGVAPLSVAFTNTTSGTVTAWTWNFGDGTTSNAQAPVHVYTAPGSYQVTLTAVISGASVTKTSATPIVVSTAQSAYSLWGSTTTPANTAASDAAAVNLGVKFTSSQAGYITGIRFYKGTANTGTHIGTLWSSTGQKLAQATFANETASGWQQVTFATPVPITANTVYVASYFAPSGRYAFNYNYFATASFSNGPLLALKSGSSGSNGLFLYSASAVFPNASYQATNYWVDVVFKPSN